MTVRRKRPRSPFGHAFKSDLAVLRSVARATAEWEHTVTAEDYREPHLTGPASITRNRLQDEFTIRAWNRLTSRADFDELIEARRVYFLRRFDRAGYEAYLLRQEIAELRAEIRAAQPAKSSSVPRIKIS
jgi:hypothetical protein